MAPSQFARRAWWQAKNAVRIRVMSQQNLLQIESGRFNQNRSRLPRFPSSRLAGLRHSRRDPHDLKNVGRERRLVYRLRERGHPCQIKSKLNASRPRHGYIWFASVFASD